MKPLIYIAFFLWSTSSAFGQCLPDRHNTSWFNGWLSCQTSENPNPDRPESHWISYNFGHTYTLNALKIWNVNDPDILTYGAKRVLIDYSTDGRTWTEFGELTFPMATGRSDYEGDFIADFGGIEAQFLLITVVETYGNEDCAGFSEFRVSVDSTANENDDICIMADVFPNPFNESFSIYLKKKCLTNVFMALEDATGRTIIAEEQIQLYETKIINAERLSPGVYFVCLRNGEIKERYKIIKY